MKLNPKPQQVPLTNPSEVACLAIAADGADVLVGQSADADQPALSRWALPALDPLGAVIRCPLSADEDTCRTLDREGDLVAVVGMRHRLTLIELDSGEQSIPVAGEVIWARLGSDVLAIGGPDTHIRDLRTDEVRWRQDPPAPVEFSYSSLRPLVALHPDGERFAVGGSGATDVRVHSLAEPEAEPAILEGAPTRLTWLEYSPDGAWLVAIDASAKATVVWRDGERAQHLPEAFGTNLSDICSVAFHPGGEYLAAGMLFGTISVHRLTDGERVERHVRPHLGRVRAMAFTPDGDHMLSGDDNGKLLLWAVE